MPFVELNPGLVECPPHLILIKMNGVNFPALTREKRAYREGNTGLCNGYDLVLHVGCTALPKKLYEETYNLL